MRDVCVSDNFITIAENCNTSTQICLRSSGKTTVHFVTFLSPKFCFHFTCRLGEAVAAAKGNIRVICRVRPQPAAEGGAGVIVSPVAETSSVSFPLDPSAVVLSFSGGGSKIFHFDAVLKDNCHQEMCYEEARAAGA